MSNPIRFGRTLLAALVAVVLSFAATERANAQFLVGGGLVYNTEGDGDLGVQANAYVGIPAIAGLRAGGDLTFYFPDVGSLMAININAQYHVPLQPNVSVYGLAGLSNIRFSFEGTTISDTGLNLGGGVEAGIGFGSLYGEAKFVTGDFDRLVVGGGVRIPIN